MKALKNIILNIIRKLTELNSKEYFRKNFVSYIILFLTAFSFWIFLPSKLFNNPVCTVITDQNNELLGANIADDGQYRFPETKNISEKYKTALINFEDKRFLYHPGFDIFSIIRAFKQNLSNGEIASGGSTISMQVIRLSRKNKKRTYLEKVIEIFLAFRLEFSYSKNEILKLYASNAPFGGNIVGIDAAVWRYFGIKSENITWAQAATLAVLPNSPSLINPGRNRNELLLKRNKLLKNLLSKNKISQEDYELAVDEPIPDKPNPFPDIAQHLLFKIKNENKSGGFFQTTIDKNIQIKTIEIVNKHHNQLSGNGINNISAIIIEIETGNVLTYIGNSNTKNNGEDVDLVNARRTTGSILKPFLYACMLNSGDILPEALVFDIPTFIGGYSPKNYSNGYDGAVPASEALARSLNIPAVRMLRQYGVDKFYYDLQKLGFTSLDNGPNHYGLSLILGGAEGSLWDISGMYASMARVLVNYEKYGGKYNNSDYHEPNVYFKKEEKSDYQIWTNLDKHGFIDAASIWFTFDALTKLERPGIENSWESFNSSEKISWKTGTSFGFKDAWAIGVTPKYIVGVWVGNADGEGRPDLIGARTAGPVMFDIFKSLSSSKKWFSKPKNEMISVDICSQSGYLAGTNCENIIKKQIPKNGIRFDVCPYHFLYHFDKSEDYRVNINCESEENIVSKKCFVLPPSVEIYYKLKNPSYKFLSPYRKDCIESENSDNSEMEIIYPYNNSKIYIPVYLDGTYGTTVFQASHRNKNSKIFWYLNDKLISQTQGKHEIELRPKEGNYTLTIIDENGESKTCKFEVTSEK
jgi:penicillin-binding protein 1C